MNRDLDLGNIGRYLDAYDRHSGDENMQNGFAFAMLKECYPEEESYDTAKRRFFATEGKSTQDVYAYFRKLYDDAKTYHGGEVKKYNANPESFTAEQESEFLRKHPYQAFLKTTRNLPQNVRDTAFGIVFAEESRSNVSEAFADKLLAMPENERNAALWGAYVLSPETSSNFFKRVGNRLLENLGDNSFNISSYWEQSQKGVNPNTVYDAVAELDALGEDGKIKPEKLAALNKKLNELRGENSIFNEESSQVYGEKFGNLFSGKGYKADEKEYTADFIEAEYKKGKRAKETFRLVSQLREIMRTRYEKRNVVEQTLEDATVVGVEMLKYVGASAGGTVLTKNPWVSASLVGAVMYSEFKPQMFNALRHEGNMSVENANKYANFATAGMIAANYIGYTRWIKAVKPSSYLLGTEITKANARDYFFHAIAEMPKTFLREGLAETASEYMESVVEYATKSWVADHEGATFEQKQLWDNFCQDFLDTTRIMPALMFGSTLLGGGLAVNKIRRDSGAGWNLRQLVSPSEVVNHQVQAQAAMAQADAAVLKAGESLGDKSTAYDFVRKYRDAKTDEERVSLLSERFGTEEERANAKAALENVDKLNDEVNRTFAQILADAAKQNADETERLDRENQAIDRVFDEAENSQKGSPKFKIVEELLDRFDARDSVVEVNSTADLERVGYSAEKAQSIMDSMGRKGFFSAEDGKIYMLSAHFKNGVDAFRTFVHERGHWLAQKIKDTPEYAGMLQRIVQITGGEEVLRLLLPSGYANDDVSVAAEEYLMRVVERVALEDVLNANQRGIWNFFKTKLKKWFGGDRTLATMADRELAEMARSIYRRATSPEEQKPTNRWEVFTPENNGKPASGIWQVVDADALITSTDKGYDDKLQPRNRQRKGSEIQTTEIATNLNPALLGNSAKSSDGAPIIDARGMVISGNGRTLAIRKAYEAEKPERAQAYKNFVYEQAERLGLDVPANIKKPMLVRRVDDLGGMSMEEFAARSNKSDLAKMSNAENAIADARRILDAHLLDSFFPSDNGDVLAASNNDFVTGFLDIIGGREEYIDKHGARKPNLAPRIKSAVLAAMLNPEKRDIIENLLDNPQGWNGLINGLFGSVANLAKLDGNADYNLADELSKAVEIFVGLQRAGESVATFNAQGDMFNEPISDEVGFLIELFEKNMRTPTGISGVLNEYYNLVKNIDTTTQDMYGAENPSKIDELRAAYQKYSTSLTEEPNVSWRDTGEPTAAEIAEAQRQKDEVKTKWTNPDGTMKKGYHCAPNGKPSKLSEEQWLWVRTPNFKRWFGDWESLAEAYPENEIFDIDEAYKFARKNLQGGSFTSKDGYSATLGREGIDKMNSGLARGKTANNRLHALAFANIGKLFGNSELLETEPPKDGNTNIKRYLKFYAPLYMDGLYAVKITVKELSGNNGNRLYSIEGLDITKESEYRGQSRGSKENSIPADYSDSVNNFVKKLREVKENVSQVVDENGELIPLSERFDEGNPDMRWKDDTGARAIRKELPNFIQSMMEIKKGLGENWASFVGKEFSADLIKKIVSFNIDKDQPTNLYEYNEKEGNSSRSSQPSPTGEGIESDRRDGRDIRASVGSWQQGMGQEASDTLLEEFRRLSRAQERMGEKQKIATRADAIKWIRKNVAQGAFFKNHPNLHIEDLFEYKAGSKFSGSKTVEALLEDSEEYSALSVFDQIRIAAVLQRRELKNEYKPVFGGKESLENDKTGGVFVPKNEKVAESQILAADTIRGCDNDCYDCYANKLSKISTINFTHKVPMTLDNIKIKEGQVIRIGTSGDPASNWTHSRNEMIKLFERAWKGSARVKPQDVSFEKNSFVITKLQSIQGYDPKVFPNLEVSLDPFYPEDMFLAMKNLTVLMAMCPDVNVVARIRSFNSNRPYLKQSLDSALQFCKDHNLRVLETRMRFESKTAYSLLGLVEDDYQNKMSASGKKELAQVVGKARFLPNFYTEEEKSRLLFCGENGELGCGACQNCVNTQVYNREQSGRNSPIIAQSLDEKQNDAYEGISDSDMPMYSLKEWMPKKYDGRFGDSTNLSENQENSSRLRFLLRQERTENPVIWASIVLAKEILNGRGITRAKVEKLLPTEQFDGSKQNYAVERAQRIAEKTKATQKQFSKDLDIAIRKAESNLYWQDEFVENAYRAFSKGGEEYGFAKQRLMQYLKDLRNKELNKVKGYETDDFDVDLVDAILKAQEAEPERAANNESKTADDELEEELEESVGAFEGDEELSGKKVPLAPSNIRDVIGAIRREVVKRVRDSDGDQKTLDEKYRKTLVNVLSDAMKELVYGKEREDIGKKIEELKTVKHAVITVKDGERVGQKIDNFTLRAENIALRIFRRGVRDDKKAMAEKLDAILERRGKKPSRMQRDDKRSMTGLVQQRIYNISKYVKMDAEALEDVRREAIAKLEDVDGNFVQDAEKGKIREDVEDVLAELENVLHDIEMFGGWTDKSRAEMAQALEFLEKTIDTETAAQRERVEKRKERNAAVRKIISDALKMSEHNASRDGGMRVAIRKVLNGSLPFDSFLGLLGETATGETRKLFEDWRRDFVARIDRAANAKANEVFQTQQKFIKLVEESYSTDFHDALKRLLEKKGEYEKFSKMVDGMRQPMSLANVIQLYVSAAQKNYERNFFEHRVRKSEEDIAEYRKIQNTIDSIQLNNVDEYAKGMLKQSRESLERARDAIVARSVSEYISELEEVLSDGDKRFIEGLRQLYKDELPSISAVAKRVIGLPIEQADALYMPVKVKRSGNLGEGVPQVPVVPKSLSQRVPHLRDLDETADPISLFTDRISENAQFKHFSELYIEMRGIFGDGDLQDLIKQRCGADVLAGLKEFIADIATGKTRGPQNELLRKTNGLTAVMLLGFNLGSGVRQVLPGVASFAPAIGGWNVFKNMMSFFTPEGFAAALEICRSDTGRRRFEIGNMQIMEELLSTPDRNRFWAAYKRHALFFNRFADKLSIMFIGQGIYRSGVGEYLRKGFSEADAKRLAMADMWQIAERTQASGRTHNMSHWQRRGGEYGKALGLFSSPPQLMFSMAYAKCRRALALGVKTPEGRAAVWDALSTLFYVTVCVEGSYAISGVLWNALLKGFFDDDDGEQILKQMALGPFGGLFVFGRIIEGAGSDYGTSLAPIEQLSRPIRHTKNLLFDAGQFDADKAMEDLDKLAKSLFPLYRDASKLYENRMN